MPNWCANTVNIIHEDPAMIVRARSAFEAGKFLNEFIPIPESLNIVSGSVPVAEEAAHEAQKAANIEAHGYKDWYDFSVNEWGTKWDIGGSDGNATDIPDGNGVVRGLSLSFDSAWAPPITAYERLMEHGFKIEAWYYEPGMAFCGKWEDGVDDYYEYSGMNSDEVADTLPPELDEMFCISESMADWESEQENEDIDLDGGLSAVNEQENENE